jgi:hypothetical protein
VTRQPESEAPGLSTEVTPEVVTPGAAVGGGRYRLLEHIGGDDRVGAMFWRARDSVLDRDVALATLAGPDGSRSVQAAMAADRLGSPGIARLLDAVSDPHEAGPGLTGLVVTEWIHGTDLAALAIDAGRTGRTVPTGVIARALSPVAAAVEAAHRAGLTLGIDHPQRIRIGADGQAKVAFPLASPSQLPEDDVRGLGAAIYLLVTGRWPLSDPPAGLLGAPSSATGVALPPQALRPHASPTLSMLATRCLAGASGGGVSSGAAVHQLLEQVTNAEADTMLMSPVPAATGTWTVAPERGTRERPDGGDPEHSKRRKLAIALSVLGAAVLTLFIWLGSTVVNFLSGDPSASPPSFTVPSPGGGTGSGSPGGPPGTSGGGSTQPVATGPIQAVGIEVFDVTGDPDNANRANRAIDGNLRSSWKTYDYNQPFPTLKAGVGVVVSFAEPVKLAAVQIDSPSAGSTIEVRTAPSGGGAGLAGTAVLGTGTLNAGRTEIKLNAGDPSQRILLWITGLSTVNGKNATQFDELTFVRAG